MQLYQQHVKIGACSINSDPLDFKRNFERIMKSIKICKDLGCSIRMGGEMEVAGYLSHDHFLQYDTTMHSWEVIRDILASGITQNIVCDIGIPMLHKAALYCGKVILHNKKVIGLRPKMHLADGGNYFQTRHWAHWKETSLAQFILPKCITDLTGQKTAPIGNFILNFNDTSVAFQICEEAWISENISIKAALDGAQIFLNSSASEGEKGKLKRKLQMITEITEKHGGGYIYCNIKGANGGQNYFDGGVIFTQNGKIKELSELHELDDISVLPIFINLNSIRTYRLSNRSFQKESNGVSVLPRVTIPISISHTCDEYEYESSAHIAQLKRKIKDYQTPHATFEPSVFLWDYLRKSGARGFVLPLSGGVDSCCVALVVYNMCELVFKHIVEQKKEQILLELRKILRSPNYTPQSAKQLCSHILFTCYLGTQNSSQTTLERARKIAQTLGICHHKQISFDNIYKSYPQMVKNEFGLELKFAKEGGSWRSDLSLQNVQARTRMVLTYLMANVFLEKEQLNGFLLVLGSSNLDEALRGYFTKYDCSSADINPIGSFSKNQIRKIMNHFAEAYKFEFIPQVLKATPSAELRPLKQGETAQSDEQDMGLTYDELSLFGKARKIDRCGPVSMFQKIYAMKKYSDPQVLADKIKKFFVFYGLNRHKSNTVTPGFHYDPEGADDHRYDVRPLFYSTDWKYQFDAIDRQLQYILSRKSQHCSPCGSESDQKEFHQTAETFISELSPKKQN